MILRPRIVVGLVVSGVVLLAAGCTKKPAVVDTAPVSTGGQPPTNPAEAATATAQSVVAPGSVGGNPTADLDALTQALRKYSIEHRSVPRTFAEMIAAGYVKNLPAAPPGKKFEIDPKTSRVILINQ